MGANALAMWRVGDTSDAMFAVVTGYFILSQHPKHKDGILGTLPVSASGSFGLPNLCTAVQSRLRSVKASRLLHKLLHSAGLISLAVTMVQK